MSSPTPPSAAEVEAAFLSHIQAHGIAYPGPVLADGKKHRVALEDDKPGEKSGVYVLHLNGWPAGVAWDYHNPLEENIHWKWEGDMPAQTPTDRRAQAEAADRRKAEREAAEASDKAEAATKAQREWDQGGEAAPDHGYLRAKGIKAHGIRQAGPVLLVPVLDIAGKLHGLQRIHENSDKRFGKDEAKSGHFAPAGGDWLTAPRIFLAEGYATAATLYEAHEPDTTAALAAFDKGNLAAVARVIREARPDAAIIIAGDNDQWKTPGQNPGEKSARAAAEAIGAPVVIPTFAPRHCPAPGIKTGPTDWNDLARIEGHEGPEEVRRQIAEQLAEQLAAAPAPRQEGPAEQTQAVPVNQPDAGESSAPADEDSQADPRDEWATVRHLAALDPFAYDRQRKTTANALGCTVATLDQQVKRERALIAEAARPSLVERIEPWPERVNGVNLIADIRALAARYMVLPDGAADVIALWILGTYCFDAFRIFPKLLITSPEKRCGKSTLLSIVSSIASKGITASNISASAIFRVIENASPTLCIDEADTFINNNDDLRGVVNSGHTKETAYVIRVESNKVTGELEPKLFSTWAPMLIAMIKDPPDTIRDRSLAIRLRRRMPGESAAKLPLDLKESCLPIRRRCFAWALEHMEELRNSDPIMPKHTNDRAIDNWTPVFAIAETIRGNWPKSARAAFEAMTPGESDDDSIGYMILGDLKRIFSEAGRERLHSQELVQALVKLEERPWATWKNGKELTSNSLAKMLKPFGIESKQLNIAGTNRNGYVLDEMADAFSRYLPATPGSNAGNPTRHVEEI